MAAKPGCRRARRTSRRRDSAPTLKYQRCTVLTETSPIISVISCAETSRERANCEAPVCRQLFIGNVAGIRWVGCRERLATEIRRRHALRMSRYGSPYSEVLPPAPIGRTAVDAGTERASAAVGRRGPLGGQGARPAGLRGERPALRAEERPRFTQRDIALSSTECRGQCARGQPQAPLARANTRAPVARTSMASASRPVTPSRGIPLAC